MQTLSARYPVHKISLDQFPATAVGLDHIPSVLNLIGNVQALKGPMVSIVGTRNPSPYGLRAATYFSRELAGRGFTVVSGLAVGIDAAAHRACLKRGGTTVAVVAHGLDQMYPCQNRPLAQEILESGGAILSEFEAGTPPLRHHFPMRNRIISALSVGSLIVEASAKSGSLITARHAVDQGKEVLVVPGPFDSVGFRGSHSLLREGAKLVDSIEEVLAELGPLPLVAPHLRPLGATEWEEGETWRSRFLRLEGRATLMELAELSNLSVSAVIAAMNKAETEQLVDKTGLQTWVWIGGATRQTADSVR